MHFQKGDIQNHQEVSTDILYARSGSNPSNLIPPESYTHVSRLFFFLSCPHSFNYLFKKFLRMIKQMLLKLYLNNWNHTYGQFSHSVVSNSLRTHGPQQARIPCPLLTPRACTKSCPLSQWCHPTISFSAIPFSSCLQSFLALGSFQMSQFFASGGQSIRFSFNISPSNEYSGLISVRMHWFDLLAVQGTLKSLLQHHRSKASVRQHSAFFIVQL